MTRLSDPQLPQGGVVGPVAATIVALVDYLRKVKNQLNGISEGSITAVTNANTVPPSGSIIQYTKGDKIWNSAPAELGTAGSKYIIIGWICVVSGAPGTWLQMRVLTGN